MSVADVMAISPTCPRLTIRLGRGDVYETREGVCRVGPPLVRELAAFAPMLREAVAPHAERLARTLLKAPDHATPLTQTRQLRARNERSRAARNGRPRVVLT